MSRCAGSCLLTLLCLSLSCTSSPELVGNGTIRCASDADCPDGYRCQAIVERCFLTAQSSSTAPALQEADSSLVPSLVAAQGTFTVTLVIDRELAAIPAIRAVHPNITLELPVTASGSRRFNSVFTFATGAPEGFYDVIADLVASDGNAATNLRVGTVELDATVPALESTTVSFRGAADNPLPDHSLRAARPDTETRVQLVASEALAGAVLAPVDSIGSLRFTSEATSDPTVFESSVIVTAGGPVDGIISTVVTLTDLAGNVATVAGPSLEFASATPALEVDESRFQIVRSPDGNATPEALGTGLEVPAGPHLQFAPKSLDGQSAIASTFRFADGSPVDLLRLWSNEEATTLVGTVAPSSDGAAWPRSFFALVPERVWLTAVDRAGNDSMPFAVRDYEWVGTLNQRLDGSGYASLDALPSARDALTFSVSTPIVDSVLVGGIDDSEWVQGFVARFDERVRSSGRPSERTRASSAYDRARGALLLFGGVGINGASAELWEWDDGWFLRAPAGPRPENRAGAMMTFADAQGVTVLFGGEAANRPTNDTWSWDGSRWRDLGPDSVPPPRSDGMIAHDVTTGVTVLFGGLGAGGIPLGDTWLWDGVRWSSPALTAAPSPRAFAAMAYSPESGGILLFGGRDAGGARLNDTWLWSNGRWDELAPTTVPPARARARLISIPSAGATLLVGGRIGASSDYAWTGSDWRIARPADDAEFPESPWVGHHEGRETTLLFSGTDIFDGIDQLYGGQLFLENGRWVFDTLTTIRTPVQRSHMFAFYPEAGASILYGGYLQGNGSTLRLDYVYAWNGRYWREITGSALPRAAGRHSGTFYYDETAGTLAVYGGSSNDSLDHRGLRFESGSYSWEGRALFATNPGDVANYAAAYSPGNSVVEDYLYLLPPNSSTLWRYDGLSWSQAPTATSGPPPRAHAAMVVDTARREVLLFGGRDGNGEREDFWAYDIDGAAWREVPVATSWPRARSEHGMIYVPESELTYLLFGGEDSSPALGDLWSWNGSEWAEVPIDGPRPEARRDFGLAYDHDRGVLVIASGSIGGGTSPPIETSDLWELTVAGDGRPALQASFSLSDSGIPLDGITALEVRAWCAGDYPPTPAVNRGADLRLWRSFGDPAGAGWNTVDRNEAGLIGLGDPALSFVESVSPNQYISGSDASIAVQCRLTGDSPSSDGRVGLDYAEVRVRYQLPPVAPR